MGTRDTLIREGAADTTHGDELELAIDLDDGGVNQGLIRFENIFAADGGPIPDDATINSAQIGVFSTNTSSATSVISFNQMLMGWDEDADTWSTLFGPLQTDDVQAKSEPSGTIAPANFENRFGFADVTTSIQAWAAGEPNFGWLVTSNVGDGFDILSSEGTPEENRPKLVIDFTPPQMDPDFDGDGDVDADDFQILSGNMYAHLDGTDVSFEDGDIDFDQDIDLVDFRQFKAQFPGAVAAAQGVPEPGTLGLLAAGLAGTFLVRLRWHVRVMD
jgi:hypothetical protein